jgi:hypothetical protein
MRPGLLLRVRLPAVTITEDLLSIRERPFESDEEARRFGNRGLYAADGPLRIYGRTVIRCRTSGGLLDFAVQKRDAHVLVGYLNITKVRQAARHSPLQSQATDAPGRAARQSPSTRSFP